MTTDTDMDGAWPLPKFGGVDPKFCPGSNPDAPQEFPEQRFPSEAGRVELLGPEPEEARPVAQVFGIIDPDYARIFTQARIAAWQYGYACLAHGSFTRDLDLLLVPWADRHVPDAAGVVRRIADVCGLTVQGEPSDKPHGRKAWSLLLPGFAEVRWVDVSAIASPAAAAPAALSEEQILSCVRSVGTPVPMGLTRDRGPHEVTEPSWFLIQLVRAIERAHGITAPSAAEG